MPKIDDQTAIFREFPEYSNSSQGEKNIRGLRFIDLRFISKLDLEFMTNTLGQAIYGKEFNIGNQEQAAGIIIHSLGFDGIINLQGQVLCKQQGTREETIEPTKTQMASTTLQGPKFKKEKTDLKNSEKIKDFGEKIGGARKDLYKYGIIGTIKDDNEFFQYSTSHLLPTIKYEELFRDCLGSKEEIAFLKYTREHIYRKPSKNSGHYNKEHWVEQIKQYRIMLEYLINRPGTPDENRTLFDKFNIKLDTQIDIKNYMKMIIDLGFPEINPPIGKFEIIQFSKTNEDAYIILNNRKIVINKTTWADAIDFLNKTIYKGTAIHPKKAPFKIYQYKTSKEYIIGRKTGSKIVPVMGIESYKAGIEYIREHSDKLESIWQQMTIIPKERPETNETRTGQDYRNGKNISPEEFSEKFGFRGVEFGNWVTAEERQEALNKAYDAFIDLSKSTGISTHSLSLNGELALAFGSRGIKDCNAHYEPKKIVINLTRKKGAGALAHEWWHALDNYFARKRNGKKDYITEEAFQKYNETLRPEVINAYIEIVHAIKKMDLHKRSMKLDSTRSIPYWSKMCEMTARVFESFVFYELKKQNIKNDYLVNFKNISAWNLDKDRYPYPTEAENEIINNSMKHLFSIFHEKKNIEKHNVTALYKKIDDDIFYSNAEYAVKLIQQEKATPMQWLRMLEKNGGIKAGEDKWTGLSEWLINSTSKYILKTEILTYIHANKINIEERLLPAGESFKSKYLTTSGLENKKEIVFWTNNIESWNTNDEDHFGKATKGKAIAWCRFGEITIKDEKYLIIDEIQSQRHQQRKTNKQIPEAPFEKNWHEFVMKRMLRYAAENGFSKICWTTGQQQIDRYDLYRNYELTYSPTGTGRFPGKLILLGLKKEHTQILDINTPEELIKIIGEKTSKKIISGINVIPKIKISYGDHLCNLYDNMLPSFINKYGKKWSIKSEQIKFSDYLMHSANVTSEMKESVMEGQALFRSINNNKVDILKKKKETVHQLNDLNTIQEIEKSAIIVNYISDEKFENHTIEEINNKIKELGDIFDQDVQIITTKNQLPHYLRQQMDDNGRYPGVYDTKTNKVYINTSEIKTLTEVEMVLKHEILGHRGIRALKKDKLHNFLDKVYLSMPDSAKKSYRSQYVDKYIATEEYIADQAMYHRDLQPFQKIKAIFRECLRNWGFKIKFTDKDIMHILTNGKKNLQRQVYQKGKDSQKIVQIKDNTQKNKHKKMKI